MHAGAFTLLAYFNLGGGEIILILALVLILFKADRFSGLARGLWLGIDSFGKKLGDKSDEEASEAGRSLGGIYGKGAAQAITPDNQVAELYDPAVLGEKQRFLKVRQNTGKNRFHFLLGRPRRRLIFLVLLSLALAALLTTFIY